MHMQIGNRTTPSLSILQWLLPHVRSDARAEPPVDANRLLSFGLLLSRSDSGLLLGTQAPSMTPNGVEFSFTFSDA